MLRKHKVRTLLMAGTAACAAVLATAPAANATTGSGTVSDPWVNPARVAHETCTGAHLWGNYSNGNYYNQIAVLGLGDQLDVRYLTGGAGMVKWNGHAVWGFTSKSCFTFG